MGQRSQIYVRYTDENNNHYLTARYYQWNYGERMISRAKYTIEWIQKMLKYPHQFTIEKTKLARIMDVNFDMKDIVISQDIIKEFYEYTQSDPEEKITFNDYIFYYQGNNDGKLFIDIKENEIKYCFLNQGCDIKKIMSSSKYMNWNEPGWRVSQYIDDEQKEFCKNNIKEIPKIAKLMTQKEIKDFLNCKYEEEKGRIQI